MDFLSKPRFTSLENRIKGHHSIWTILYLKDLTPLKTGQTNNTLGMKFKLTGLRDVNLYVLFQ